MRPRRLNCRGGPLWPPVLPIHRLEYQFEPAVIERRPRRSFHLRDPFAQSLLRQLERAMMTIGIVSGASEQNTRGPRTAGFARISVVTTATEAPQLFARSAAIDVQLIGRPPDIFETEIANVAAGISRSRERRTTLDRAVSLDAERVLSSVTTRPVNTIVAVAAPD